MSTSLSVQLKSSLENIVEQYVKKIVQRYPSTEEKVLLDLFNNSNSNSSSRTSSKNNSTTCQHKFIKGKNANTYCTSKATKGEYCSVHSKDAEKSPKKKILPAVKKSESKPSIVLKTHRQTRKLYHPETNIVFDVDTQEVIGKIVDDKLADLTSEDLDTCKRFGFVVEKELEEKLSRELEPELELELEPEPDDNDRNAKIALGLEDEEDEDITIDE